jgi:hypothetical protein
MILFIRIVSIVLLLISIFKIIKKRQIRKEISDWEIDDIMIIYNKDGYAILKGWSNKTIVVEFINDGDYDTRLKIKDVKLNKSAYWRRLHSECKKTMGKNPKFSDKVNINKEYSSKNSKNIFGKPIDLLSETECQVYLKQCLDKEDYETAELIRVQMEKFR